MDRYTEDSLRSLERQPFSWEIPDSVGGYPVRKDLYPEEDALFLKMPHVAGMASEDGSVILNPYSRLSPRQKAMVARMEAGRHHMGYGNDIPVPLTPAQQRAFAGYGPPWAQKQTVVSRAMINDPSGLDYTPQQRAYAAQVNAALDRADQDPPTSTRLPAWEERRFRKWADDTSARRRADGGPPIYPQDTGYDYRGFWSAQQAGFPQAQEGGVGHFPDLWKTPQHPTYSTQSLYAKPNAPEWLQTIGNMDWRPGDWHLVDPRTKRVIENDFEYGDPIPEESRTNCFPQHPAVSPDVARQEALRNADSLFRGIEKPSPWR